jgi:hypothetical protein
LPVDRRSDLAPSRAAVAKDLIQFDIADLDDISAAHEPGVRDGDAFATSSGR